MPTNHVGSFSSLQYTNEVCATLDYLAAQRFHCYFQWLNPGYGDAAEVEDRLGLVRRLLSFESPTSLAVRDGRANAEPRVQELRQVIYGWARYRDLIVHW